jgi:hypothetical protein
VKNIKFAVLACGLIGLIGCFIPDHGHSFWDAHQLPSELGGGIHVYMVMAGYALATVMGVVALAKGLKRPQAITALIGFAFVLWKFRSLIGEALKHGGVSGRMMMLSAIVGVVVSIAGAATGDET